MTIVGFLHTAAVHVPTFERLTLETAADASSVAVVDEALLANARLGGVEAAEVQRGIERALAELVEAGADVIVCTCSTIGGEAERLGRESSVDVVRVDRPLAELAVRTGERIAVVAAVESTLAPTRALLRSVAAEAALARTIDVHLIDGAWERFEAGDLDGYHRRIADALPGLAASADVVVLAQASMAPAGELVTVDVPVLASPRVAVEHVLAAR